MLGVLCLSGALETSATEEGNSTQQAKPLTAILIVARAELPDPNFEDAVVLVMNNLAPGPVGIVINRPTPLAVSQLFPQLKQVAQLHDKVYFGGPVEVRAVWFLFRAATPPKDAVRAFDDIYLSGSRELLLRLLRREKPMEGLRIFMGHSGWGPGQLEAEIQHGDWVMRHAEPDAIFHAKPEHPWPATRGPDDTT
jgi:putative transcriptional regulator